MPAQQILRCSKDLLYHFFPIFFLDENFKTYLTFYFRALETLFGTLKMGKISQKSQKNEFEQAETNICHMEYQDMNSKIHMSQLAQLEGTQSALLWLVLNNAFCTISANISTKGIIPIWAS